MALIAETPSARPSAQAGAAFSTPSVVHFAVVLLLSAIISAPWHGIGAVGFVLGLVGISGIAYGLITARRMQLQTAYRPVFEDWLFHCLLPLAAYGILVVSAFVTRFFARPSMFLVAASTLLLLFVGIHNAWDAVTFHVLSDRRGKTKGEQDR